MKRYIKYCLIVLISVFISCSNDVNEKHLSKRNNIEDVHNRVQELNTGDVLITMFGYPYIFDNYLIISDWRSTNKLIYVFDSKSFKFIGATGDLGQGPMEISNLMDVFWNSANKELYALDNGSQNIYSFNMDSIINNSDYKPVIKQKLNASWCPGDLCYINDTLAYCYISKRISDYKREEGLGTFNLKTGEAKLITYNYPDLIVKVIQVAASEKYQRIVVCNTRFDIMSVLDFNRKLICNVYGPNWVKKGDYKQHYGNVTFYNGYILALYDGNLWSDHKYPTKIIVYSLNGDYIKTLETGYQITKLAADEQNHRLIFSFYDEIQFGYLDMDEIL